MHQQNRYHQQYQPQPQPPQYPPQQQYQYQQPWQPPAQQFQPPAQQFQPPAQQFQPPAQPFQQPQTPQLPLPPQPPQQRTRLDPRSIPSAVKLIDDDIENFKRQENPRLVSTAPATLPPLVTTLESRELMVSLQDGGCARPCHMRSTIYNIPATKDLLESSGLEFSVVVKPFDIAEVEGTFFVPLSSSDKIVRCDRCKAYMNPFSRSGKCCICNVPTQNMQEFDERPELSFGSYEFRCSADYYRNQIAESRRPHIIFAIEATANSKHLVHFLSKNLAKVIQSHLPTDFLYSSSLSPLVGFVTYNSKITIHDVTNGIDYVVPDVGSVTECVPTSTFLVDPDQNSEAIEKFLTSLPDLCHEELELDQQTVLGPVVKAALATCLHDRSNFFQEPNPEVIATGKMCLLHSSLPTFGDDATPGRLGIKRNIEDMKRQLGSENENKALKPDGKYYSELAQKCVTDYGTGIELYLFPPNPRAYLNLATISDLACLTGTGVVNKYNITSMDRFIEDLKLSLKSTMGFDASMRVRTSTGISPVRYIGNFNRSDRSGSNLEMASVSTSSNFIVQIRYDDKLAVNELVVVQFAMIYTSVCGERRVRVHNLALTACQTHKELYQAACCETLMNVITRDAIDKMRSDALNPKTAKEQITSRVTNILTAYRKHCGDPGSNSSQLILPEGLKLLPVYLCGALKCDAIDGGPEMFPDDKIIAQVNLFGALPSMSQVTFYPRVYAIDQDANNEYRLVAVLFRCIRQFIDEEPAQCFVLENGYYLFIYFPKTELGDHFLERIFGHRKDDPELIWDFRQRDSDESKFLEDLIDRIITERRRTLVISIVRQSRDRVENVFNTFLYEDRKRPQSGPGAARYDNLSYPEMLCFLHGEIRSRLSS